jgi:hypothetical protein
MYRNNVISVSHNAKNYTTLKKGPDVRGRAEYYNS